MLNRPKALSTLLALGVAGCATGPRRDVAHAPDWGNEEAASTPVSAPIEVPAPAPVAIIPPPASPANKPTQTWVPLNRWCKENGLPAPSQLAVAPMPIYALHTGNGVLTLHARNQTAQWDSLELRLGFPPQMINGEPYVHALDLQKTIQPLLLASQLQVPATNPVIVIDPGHGGENAGTKSVLGNHYEKEFTLDWARRLEPLLTANGWQVFLTRTNDVDLALSNRVAFAEAHKAHLFLSLHFNSAAPNEVQAGLETYCLTPVGMSSTVTRGFTDDASEVFPNNNFDVQNLQLAFRIHRALLQVNGNRDRGLRRARFPGVLRGQQRPAVLVEGGYLSNPQEAKLISEPAYRQRLAVAVAAALGDVGAAEEIPALTKRTEAAR